MCLRARKTKRYGQRVAIVSYYVGSLALQFQKPKTKGRQTWQRPGRPKVLLRHCAPPYFISMTPVRGTGIHGSRWSTLAGQQWTSITDHWPLTTRQPTAPSVRKVEGQEVTVFLQTGWCSCKFPT